MKRQRRRKRQGQRRYEKNRGHARGPGNYQPFHSKISTDILRVLFEHRDEPIDRSHVIESLEHGKEGILKTLDDLHALGFIGEAGEEIMLTHDGKALAEFIEKKHLSIENVFGQLFNAAHAHEIAHFLEHEFTDEILLRFQRAQVDSTCAIPISHYKLRTGVIKHVNVKDFYFFNKVISLGLIPGESIEIVQDNQVTFLIRVKDSRLAIDKDLANEILVAPSSEIT